MRMRRRVLMLFAMVGLAVAPIALSQRVSRAELRFQEAHRKETIDGDLKSAIDLYRRAIAEAGSNRSIAAQALVRMAQCYEKLGDAEARKAYDRVVREFGDQKDPAATAHARLAALGGLSYPSGITLRKVWAIDGWLEGSPSPDGRYHSFTDWETGDLAVRDLATGQNRRITNKGSWNDSDEFAEASVISGDGKQIAYAWYNKENYYELRVIGIDGSNPRTVYIDKEFGYWIAPYQWTADGKQILAVPMGEKEWRIALIPVAGGPVRFLKTPAAQRPWEPNLSPDGRFLVYGGRGVAAVGEGDVEDDVFLLSTESGQEVPLVQSPADDFSPVWMPDGKKVLFVSDRTGTRGFWTIDVVEGKPRGIPQLLKDGVGVVGSLVRPAGFTRQGTFYYSTTTSIGDVYLTELDPAEGKMLRQPVPIVPRFVGSNSAPSWSPDGRFLAYYRRGDAWRNEPPTLVILSVETGEARDVPVKLKQHPAPVIWRPDGKSVFVTAPRTPTPDVLSNYRVDVQTGEHVLVRSFRHPIPGAGDITRDGKTHYWFTREEPKPGLGVISCDMATGQQREIARVSDLAKGGFPRLTASPDSKYLALCLPIDGGQWTAFRVAPATGGEWRELYRFRKSEDVQKPAWTPDGGNLLFLRRTGKDGIPELWRIPVAGGEPQRTGLSMEGMGSFSLHPDGRRIAFETGGGRRSPNELWVLENFSADAK